MYSWLVYTFQQVWVWTLMYFQSFSISCYNNTVTISLTLCNKNTVLSSHWSRVQLADKQASIYECIFSIDVGFASSQKDTCYLNTKIIIASHWFVKFDCQSFDILCLHSRKPTTLAVVCFSTKCEKNVFIISRMALAIKNENFFTAITARDH